MKFIGFLLGAASLAVAAPLVNERDTGITENHLGKRILATVSREIPHRRTGLKDTEQLRS